jgi:hypothetical protein
MKFQAPADRAGTIRPCPDCNHLVRVGDPLRQRTRLWLVVPAIILMIVIIMMNYLTIFGRNANTAFGTAGTQ